MTKKSILLLSVVFACMQAFPQLVPYKNPSLTVEERVKDLLARMTPEEKFWQLFMIPGGVEKGEEDKYKAGIFGFQVSTSPANSNAAQQLLNYGNKEDALSMVKKINTLQKIFVEKTRLGIPIIAFDEGLHGLVRSGCTVFPQAIALAATWDTALVQRVAGAIATETRIRGIRQVLSPVVNIASDVRWGRVEETYGEDPFLSSEMAVSFVSAFEKMNIIATPKHFIANIGDGGRDSYPIHYDERLLEEIYFPPFKAAIERGGARSIMTAYNSLDGVPCSSNDWLLTKKLKGQWNFHGFVISDAGAVGGANVLHYTAKDYPASGEQAINNGLDVIFQTAYDHYKLFIPGFLDGSIDKNRINDAVSRVLRAKFELGLFDRPYTDETAAGDFKGDSMHRDLSEKASIESIVLLKNEQHVLPVSKNIRSIAVIGTDAVEARLGGYSGPGTSRASILEGIKKRGGSSMKVLYEPGCGRNSLEWVPVPSEYLSCTVQDRTQKGLKGEYFNNITETGTPSITRVDANINFQWTLFSPDPAIPSDFYSVRWTGRIHSPNAGPYRIGIEGNDGFRLYIDNRLLIDNWKKQSYSTLLSDFQFEAGREYNLRVEFYEPNGNAHLKLIWNAGITNDWKEKTDRAVRAVLQSDLAVVVAGIEEGEFRDRALLGLPGHQEEMIRSLAATGKPIVVLLVGGSAITMSNWLDKIAAVADLWYPGEKGGDAVAAILFGDYSPAGRLPISFPISEGQLPLVYNHKPTGRGDDYDDLSGLPLFPFGYGLSYTHFEYSNFSIDKNNIAATDSTIIRFHLKNTGDVEGDEVPQLYIRDLLASVARPVKELKGFLRVHLLPGQSKDLSFTISPQMLSMLDKYLYNVVEPGDFRIMVGASSSDIRLKGTLTVRPK